MLDNVPRGSELHTTVFMALVWELAPSEWAIPIVAMDAFKVTEATDFLLNKTSGKYSHHFILVEIGTTPPLFARIDFQGWREVQCHSVSQSIRLSAERASLTPGSASFARMSNSGPGGLTLVAFAALLKIMHDRTPRYELLSRNCIWLTECILYATGRRYSKHWRAGHVAPYALEQYVDGAIDAQTETAQIYTENKAGRVFVYGALQMARRVLWLFTLLAGKHRIRLPDEEIEEIVEEWRQYL
ncbi:hypothetical protein B0H15DRAFT_846299 [Mycena belliarum]|uniref:Uncharacterized protein n=1 Tax=Mycena belliarum TaxID=1033014 RepID=A0AAD6U0T6_9AGAR|nr:hypothetical protein B0H15DRAFT_846299 [Mycena belliae]